MLIYGIKTYKQSQTQFEKYIFLHRSSRFYQPVTQVYKPVTQVYKPVTQIYKPVTLSRQAL